jgi:hypothetical protein
MPRLILMSDAVLRCQRRADMEGDSILAPTEWKALISEQYGQLYSTVVSAGMRYFESTDTVTATGAATYPLPADHDATIGVDRLIDAVSGRWEPLGELMIQERDVMTGQVADATAYAVVGQTLVLSPRPPSGTYRHIYVPQSPDLSSLADLSMFDLITSDGEAFLIWGVAVKALPKRDRDPTLAITERDAAGKRFAVDVQRRALVNPRRRIPRGSGGAGPCGGGGYDWEYWDPGAWHWRWGQ